MSRYYTRACNFYYGNQSKKLIGKKKSISLNYNKRLNEKKNNDSKSNNLNTSVEISEIFPVKEEDLLKKIKNDLYLRESIKLFVEMLSFKES